MLFHLKFCPIKYWGFTCLFNLIFIFLGFVFYQRESEGRREGKKKKLGGYRCDQGEIRKGKYMMKILSMKKMNKNISNHFCSSSQDINKTCPDS